VTLNGELLLAIGGESNSETRLSSIEAKRRSEQWTLHPKDLPIKISRHCAVEMQNDVFIFGGYVDEDPFSNRGFMLNWNTYKDPTEIRFRQTISFIFFGGGHLFFLKYTH
jgi:hypothetical protein